MSKQCVFMFPGQGTQYHTMGKMLYEQNNCFKRWIDEARECLWQLNRVDIVYEVINTDKPMSQTFDNIVVTQPAIVIISLGIAKVLNEQGIYPELVLGTSLGEIAACIYSGASSLETMLSHICEHVQLFLDKCQSGSMVSLIGSQDDIDNCDYQRFQFSLAAKNFPGQCVIAGLNNNLSDLVEYLEHTCLIYEVLPITRAFHSPFIDAAYQGFVESLDNHNFNPLIYPLISCAKSSVIESVDPQYLWSVVREPIHFQNCVQQLCQQQDYQFIDVGPSGTLAGFINQLKRNNLISMNNQAVFHYSMKSFQIDDERFLR